MKNISDEFMGVYADVTAPFYWVLWRRLLSQQWAPLQLSLKQKVYK